MSQHRPLRIRQQLVYLILLLGLPTLALSLWQIQKVVDLRAEYELTNSQNLARLTAAQVDAYVGRVANRAPTLESQQLYELVKEELAELIPPVLTPYRRLGLIDREGNVVYSNTDEPPPWLEGSPSRSYLVARHHLSRLPWTAYAWVDRGDLLATEWPRVATSLVTFLLFGSASLLLASVITRRIVQPLNELQATAEAIAAGRLDARVADPGKADLLGGIAYTFNEMAERLASLNEDRSRFLRNTAHELRNPLAGVKGVLGLLRHRLRQGRPIDDLKRLTEAMEGEIDRISDILTEMLETFRLQSGQWQLRNERLNFIEVLDAALTPFLVAEPTHHFVVNRPDPGPVWIWGDAVRLEQVIRNLLTNATKYTPYGALIEVTLTHTADHVTLSVADQGIGIPADELNRVFEVFFRGRQLATDPGGIGLGLYYSDQVIKAHGGTLWVTSIEGAGSTFYLSLPTDNKEEQRGKDPGDGR